MAFFACFGNLRLPSPFLHYFPGPKNGIFEKVMTVDVVWIFDQLEIIDILPPATVQDAEDVPGGVVNGTDYELA
jgi:hypothetical protein